MEDGEEELTEEVTEEERAQSLLHGVTWHRVVLDEAHRIKSRNTGTAQSVFSLRSTYKWCLTGTPLQNRVGDLHSIVRFLQWRPWAFYFCSVAKCQCSSLHFRFGAGNRRCTGCGHPPMKHFSHLNKHVINPIKRFGYKGAGKLALDKLRKHVLAKMVLRRTKEEKQVVRCLRPCILAKNRPYSTLGQW